jgi:hypothetical protein
MSATNRAFAAIAASRLCAAWKMLFPRLLTLQRQYSAGSAHRDFTSA